MTESPFVIKCLSEQCTVLYVGKLQILATQLDTEINSGSPFGKKLAEARREVMELV